MRTIILSIAVALGISMVASAANAQATRTWVSGVGDDANPCSRTAPCKTFAGAISKTAAGGQIDCLDPAGYGALTITKSIIIDCHETLGSILVAGTNGIIINSDNTAALLVRLRNISFTGLVQSATSESGSATSGRSKRIARSSTSRAQIDST